MTRTVLCVHRRAIVIRQQLSKARGKLAALGSKTEEPPADPAAAVRAAYQLILGRNPDQAGLVARVAQLETGAIRMSDVLSQLASSDEFLRRLDDRITDTRTMPTTLPENYVSPEDVMAEHGIDGLVAGAEAYFSNGNPADLLPKPFTVPDETRTLLMCFAQLVGGLKLTRGMKVLDFGSGTCWTSRWLAQLGCDVTAVDVSAAALRIGEDSLNKSPLFEGHGMLEFSTFDGHTLPFADGSFDRVVCFDALHHTVSPESTLAEMSRVLVDGGRAGFVEPGPTHSQSPQSQFEMRNYVVLEADVRLDKWWPSAQEAGFTDISFAVFSTDPYHASLDDFDDFLSGGATEFSFAEAVRRFMHGHRTFFLAKGEPLVGDSRDRAGLRCEMTIELKEHDDQLVGVCRARNTGSSRWLPSSARYGPVRLGVHLLGLDNRAIDLDYARIELPGDHIIEPGEDVEIPVAISRPAELGVLEFDMVSEGVCWFAVNGSPTAQFATASIPKSSSY